MNMRDKLFDIQRERIEAFFGTYYDTLIRRSPQPSTIQEIEGYFKRSISPTSFTKSPSPTSAASAAASPSTSPPGSPSLTSPSSSSFLSPTNDTSLRSKYIASQMLLLKGEDLIPNFEFFLEKLKELSTNQHDRILKDVPFYSFLRHNAEINLMKKIDYCIVEAESILNTLKTIVATYGEEFVYPTDSNGEVTNDIIQSWQETCKDMPGTFIFNADQSVDIEKNKEALAKELAQISGPAYVYLLDANNKLDFFYYHDDLIASQEPPYHPDMSNFIKRLKSQLPDKPNTLLPLSVENKILLSELNSERDFQHVKIRADFNRGLTINGKNPENVEKVKKAVRELVEKTTDDPISQYLLQEWLELKGGQNSVFNLILLHSRGQQLIPNTDVTPMKSPTKADWTVKDGKICCTLEQVIFRIMIEDDLLLMTDFAKGIERKGMEEVPKDRSPNENPLLDIKSEIELKIIDGVVTPVVTSFTVKKYPVNLSLSDNFTQQPYTSSQEQVEPVTEEVESAAQAQSVLLRRQ